MPAFEVLILQKPTKQESDEGQYEKIVLGPKIVTGKDAQAAAFAVFVAEKPQVDPSRMEVLVRPFA